MPGVHPHGDAISSALATDPDAWTAAVTRVVADGVLELDPRGRVLVADARVAAITGRDPAALRGDHLSTLLAGDDRPGVVRAALASLDAGSDAREVGVVVETPDGDTTPCRLRLAPVADDDGLVGFVGSLRESDATAEFETFVDAVEEYAIFRLDADGRVASWNRGARRLKGYEADDIVGEHVAAFYADADRAAGVPERNLREAAERGSVDDEGWRVRADGTRFYADVTVTAIRDDDGDLQGYTKVTRDRTDEREHERRLQRERDLTRRILDVSPIAIVTFTADGELERANDRAAELLELDADGAEGYTPGDLYDADGDFVPVEQRPFYRALHTGEPVSDRLLRIERPDGESRWLTVGATPMRDDAGEVGLVVVAMEDVTALTEQHRRLERQHESLKAELSRAFGRITDAFYALDRDWRFTYLNDHAAAVLERDADDLVGTSIWNEFPEADEGVVRDEYERAMATQEPTSFDLFYEPLDVWVEVNAYPSETGLSVYFRDVTERVEREHELERYETIVETVQDGIYALDADETIVLANEAFCELAGYAREELLGRHPTFVNSAAVNEEANDLADQLARGDIDVATVEYEFRRADGSTVPVETRFALYEGDAIPGARCGVVRDVTDRKRREHKLARQREQLAALVDLNRLVNDITGAVVRQSTREEIEALVVERLAAADSYEFAWIGEADVAREEVVVRAEAGVENYLDDATIRVDASALSSGPTGRAFRTGETQVAHDLLSDPDYAPWRDHAREYGYRSSAAIPVAYEDALYGVLNVYSPRPDAFDGDEQAVFDRLGETVGHAIRAIERRNALMSDEVLQVELRLEGVFDRVGGDVPWAGRITIDRTIPVGDDAFVQYVTATPDAVDALYAVADHSPHLSVVREIGADDGGDRRFELAYADPPVTSLIASRGGRVTHAAMADRDLTLTIELPTATNVREVVEAITADHAETRVLAQRTTQPAAVGDESDGTGVLADLTDRQRTVLEAAYFSGYFEWPRETNAEDLAASMDISAPTLHQHLRKAHKGLLRRALGDGSRAG